MSTFSLVLGCNVAVIFLSLFLYVLFGQITVRKLRKNPKTKSELGLEFACGWDILNVAQALAMPKKIQKVLEKGQLAFLSANSEIISQHTNRFDKALAIIFYWMFMGSAFCMILLMVMEELGFFPS